MIKRVTLQCGCIIELEVSRDCITENIELDNAYFIFLCAIHEPFIHKPLEA